MIVGIIGGVASGKSHVTRLLESLGAVTLDADRAGHEVLADTEVKQAVRDKWGNSVFHADGQVDRAAVAKLVFAPPPEGPENLAFLESVTHPRIGKRLRRQASQLAEQGGHGVIVLDAAVLLKAGWDQFCDRLVFVDAPLEIRLQRAARRGWNEAELHRREAAQVPVEEKRRRADFVIDNSGDKQQTLQQIYQLWATLLDQETA
jgi:dephospho-CoA kinase